MNNLDQKQIERFLTELVFAVGTTESGANTFLEPGLDIVRLKSWAMTEIVRIFGLDALRLEADQREVRLRLALHLSPPDAIEYVSSNFESRKTLIKKFLVETHKFPIDLAVPLSRQVASLLDDWDADRDRSLANVRDALLAKQGGRCACCRLRFHDGARIQVEEECGVRGVSDPYKPYFDGDSVFPGMDPMVDHMKAISVDGSNRYENLQVLCGLCNVGKGNGLGISIADEYLHAGKSIRLIPRSHRMRMFYYRTQVDCCVCVHCRSSSLEVTVRPWIKSGPYCLTNLRTTCVACASIAD